MELHATQPRKILLPDIDWVEIPAGPFIYGEDSTRQELRLERFKISRYPITNCQFQCFIDAGGYAEERWWQDLKRPEPKKSTWDQPNRPRTDVDWYEAMAFTRWLSSQLNQDIRLPTEQEWEKAARGEDGRKYPWGEEYINGYANVEESGAKGEYLQQTTAVGLYPKDPSPYGVKDLAGNVWEWCLNKDDHPEQIEPDTSGDRRVLRGGSWIYVPVYARAALRFRDLPDLRVYYLGFRVVLSAPLIDLLSPVDRRDSVGHDFFRHPCRSGPCPRKNNGVPLSIQSFAPMGRSYNFLIQLPNNLPSSATIRLTCSY